MDEKFRAEKERAACRRARSDAVRFDLNADFRGRYSDWASASEFFVGDSSNTLKSSSSSSTSGEESGWVFSSPDGDDTGSKDFRVGCDFLGFGVKGVKGVSNEESVFVVYESSRDGMELTEAVRENGDPTLLSARETSSMSESSGALSSRSKGLLPRLRLNSFSASGDCSVTGSTVIPFSGCARR